MSAALGRGVRVYIGYTPDNHCGGPTALRRRCTTGTVIDGPFAKGEKFAVRGLGMVALSEVCWRVTTDGLPGNSIVAEALLTPFDDDGGRVEREQLVEVEA